jgi:hypothetical protein
MSARRETSAVCRQRFYWLQARADIEKWCRRCDTCAASHGPRTRNRGQMHQYNVGAPFERIAIDVAEPFPQSGQGIMDYFTKWPEVYAIPNQEASTIAETLVTNFFCRFGIPRELHSDQGRNFESHLLSSATRGSEQDAHHDPAPAVGWHGGALY